ncbi:hypothetical protein ABE354_19530 [Brevibacillus laterosporus]|uniref:hypothetical protein n=1 Tax=Brevibacillus laterosporus TaxID=1465 RepID=UPI003D1BB11B
MGMEWEDERGAIGSYCLHTWNGRLMVVSLFGRATAAVKGKGGDFCLSKNTTRP